MTKSGTVFVVDDDQAARDSLAALLGVAGHQVHTFQDGAAFLSVMTPETQGCVILDIRMPGMTGLDVHETMKDRHIALPVILVTGHGDIAMAVKAIKNGAYGFIEKPYRADHLLGEVANALEHDAEQRLRATLPKSEIERRLAALTPREAEVMAGVTQGLMNKQIAGELGISDRTVEIHRARVMEKMQAGSLAELIRLSVLAEAP